MYIRTWGNGLYIKWVAITCYNRLEIIKNWTYKNKWQLITAVIQEVVFWNEIIHKSLILGFQTQSKAGIIKLLDICISE